MPPAIAPTPYAERNARIIHALVAVGWSAQAQRVARDLHFMPIDLVGPSAIASLADHVATAETGRRSGARFTAARTRFLAIVDSAKESKRHKIESIQHEFESA
jgi:hypothetical protein